MAEQKEVATKRLLVYPSTHEAFRTYAFRHRCTIAEAAARLAQEK